MSHWAWGGMTSAHTRVWNVQAEAAARQELAAQLEAARQLAAARKDDSAVAQPDAHPRDEANGAAEGACPAVMLRSHQA